MGVLRGFDQFMNLVLDATVDNKTKADIGMVVRHPAFSQGRMHRPPRPLSSAYTRRLRPDRAAVRAFERI